MSRFLIIKQQQRYLSFLPHVRNQFGNLPGVQLIGLGAKEKQGCLLENWAFRFYVENKRPLNEIPDQERIPSRIFGIPTDVIPNFSKEGLNCEADALVVDDNEFRDSGIRGGISIRSEHFDNKHPSGYGTLGILARQKSDNALVGLTCAHVVNAASETPTTLNTKIGQPKYWISCCCCPRGYIGDVTKATFTDDLDCALIGIHEDILEKVVSNNTENKVEGIGADITGAAAVLCFDTFQKYGRATGLTTGKVSDVAFGTHQMLIERTGGNPGDPFACKGDSGAVIVNSANEVVGLLVAASKTDMSKVIATHIKPVMIDLGITIAGTDAADIGEPVGGGSTGCELNDWPGGNTDTALNPVEQFNSTDFGFAGNVDWDVSGGAPGAFIIESEGQAASGLESISVRYDTVSGSKNAIDAVWVKAISGANEVTKFRTVFKFTPRAVNISGALESDNTLRFAATGGTADQAGAAVHGTDGANFFLAKAEIVFDILPQDLQWSNSGGIAFVTGAPAGLKGNIIARRQTKFCKGEQANGAANRTHSAQTDWISAGDSTSDDFQEPTDGAPNELFRLANEGFDPANLLQGYWRADFRDYLEFYNGLAWVRISPFADWHANLTASLSGTGSAPPTVGAPNVIGTGANPEKIPNQAPTITLIDYQEVKQGEIVTLSATPADPDNDAVTVNWLQTDGRAVVLSSPTGNPVTFNAPNDDFQFKFTATADDGTGSLSFTAGNHLSAAEEVTVNVIEWFFRSGGFAIAADNETEVFYSADFGMNGPVNWDVSSGGTSGFIIESGGINAVGLDSITVRYDFASADQTRSNTVVIRATDPASGKIWFKRRTVLTPEWAAWPGGQANTALNPTEDISAVDMGFPAGTLLNWNIGLSLTNGVFVGGAGGQISNGVASIVARYDIESPDITADFAVRVQATNPANGSVAFKLRTVFQVTPQAPNTANILHGLGGAGGVAGRNDLRFPATDGTTTQAGVVDPTMAGVTRIATKMEQVFTISPLGIPWTRRLTSFVFDDGASVPNIINSKYECRARRDRQSVILVQAAAAGNRDFAIITQGGAAANDAAMVNDGFADSGDCQYPTMAMPNHIFRIDTPGIGPAAAVQQLSFRSNFQEYVAWHNGTAGAAGWSRITPYSAWFTNLSMALGTAANPHPNMVPPNNAGAGAGAVSLANSTPLINGGVDRTFSPGDNVSLDATFADADNDLISGTFTWTQTAGTNVIPGGVFVGNPLVFIAPGTLGRLTFTVHADDNVVNANSYNPGNSRGNDIVNVDIN